MLVDFRHGCVSAAHTHIYERKFPGPIKIDSVKEAGADGQILLIPRRRERMESELMILGRGRDWDN